MVSEGDDERRSRLLQLKLGALVEPLAGASPADLTQSGFPQGAIRHDSVVAYFLLDRPHERALGPVLLRSARKGIERIVIFVDDVDLAGVLARQSQGFTVDISVHTVIGDRSERAKPSAYPSVVDPPSTACLELAKTFTEAGLDIVVEWGIARGELLGLEIGRVVAEPEPHVETGVGDFDREISNMMRSNQTPAAAVASVVEMIEGYRSQDSPPHPMRDLVVERWIRALVIADPNRLGCSKLEAVDLTIERVDLRSNLPAAALGKTTDGETVLVICTAGLDVDLVPIAVDTALMWRDRGIACDRLLIVGDPGSFIEPQRLVAGWSSIGVEFVEFPAPNRK